MVGRENKEVGKIGMTDESLLRAAAPLDRVYDVVMDEPLHPAHHVNIVQPEIGVGKHHPFARFRQAHTQARRNGRFSDAALSGRKNDFSRQSLFLPPFFTVRYSFTKHYNAVLHASNGKNARFLSCFEKNV